MVVGDRLIESMSSSNRLLVLSSPRLWIHEKHIPNCVRASCMDQPQAREFQQVCLLGVGCYTSKWYGTKTK